MKTRALPMAIAMASLLTMALVGAGCTSAGGTGASAEGSGDALANTVTAQGEGESWMAPDIAQISLGVTKQAEKSDAALAEASQVASAVVDAVKAAGVEEKDIQTQWVNLEPRYTTSEDAPPVISGYQANVMVSVKVRDIGSIGAVLEGASKAGITDVSSLSFQLDDDAEAQDEAITNAVDDARARAAAMAAASDRELGEVVRVSETALYEPAYEANYTSALMRSGGDYALDAALQPGQIQTTAQVTVVFELQ